MGEPTGDLTPDEAVDKSGTIYTELNEAVNSRVQTEYLREVYRQRAESYDDAIRLLAFENAGYFDELPDSTEIKGVDTAIRVLDEYKKMYSDQFFSMQKEAIDSEKTRKVAVGEAHELYQDRDNKEAIQDAAVQDIGPENTSFGKSQQAEKDHDTQASN